MGSKNKTVSFRVGEETFDRLKGIADEKELSLSAVFREYVQTIIEHDGHVEVVPEDAVREAATDGSATFPQTVEVPKSFVREHERLELECEHLREQLDEFKQEASKRQAKLDRLTEEEAEMVRLEEVDYEAGTSVQVD